MTSDLGPGDLVVAVADDNGDAVFGLGPLVGGRRYRVAHLHDLPTRPTLVCRRCGQSELSVEVELVPVAFTVYGPIGHCPCRFRRIGGPSVMEEFRRQLLAPVPTLEDA